MSQKSHRGKSITQNQITGQKGVNLIEAVVLEMGYTWKPTTAVTDAGIDGDIEIRDPQTEEATNFLIRVQSKATEGQLESETKTSFIYRVKERDLSYWLRGNAPVLLVVVLLNTKEMYWIPVKEYFNTPERRMARKVIFDKESNRFNKAAAVAVAELALPAEQGIYLHPPPKAEELNTNLLEVAHYGSALFVAQTPYATTERVEEVFHELDERPGRVWFVKENKIFSFNDLNKYPWTKVTDSGTVESFKSVEWARSKDDEQKRDFVRLLNQALRTFAGRKDLGAFPQRGRQPIYYFRPRVVRNRESDVDELVERDESWHGQKDNLRRVVERYYSTKEPKRLLYYRHHAFTGRFRRFGGKWYVEITPTYHYTSDGRTTSPYREENLAGMKRQEGHAAVANNVRFLGHYLAYHDLYNKEYHFLRFGKFLEENAEFGIHEGDWKNRVDPDEVPTPETQPIPQAQSQLELS